MYGRVTKCFHDKGFAFIHGEDGNSYFAHYSLLNGEHIEKGYYVFFVPFMNDRSDYNAMKVSVIYIPEEDVKEKPCHHKKKQNNSRHRKPCNANRVAKNDKNFTRFVKNFMYEQKERKKNICQ